MTDTATSSKPQVDPVRMLQVIHVALAGGVLVMMSAVIVMYQTSAATKPGSPPAGAQAITLLSGVHALLALTVCVIAPLVARAQIRRASNEASSSVDGSLASAAKINRVRGAVIVQLALYESAALFGLIVCIVATTNRVLETQPIYWLNGASAILFLAYVAASFPTEERMLARLPND